ncbi:MAG: alpha/beta fold hydrolase [Cyanophyceae cyanobacterium]
MSRHPKALWLNTNPHFKRFNQPLLRRLSHRLLLAEWDYQQNCDEASSLDIALVLLHDYLKSCSEPIHLLGHSTGGLLGLLYTRQYPERVKSLTLLGVGVHPAVDWQAHYYVLRQLLPCSREVIMTQMVRNLFGYQGHQSTKALLQLLKRDLETSPSPHSLYQQVSIPPGGVSVPLLVCGGEDDVIVDRNALQSWQSYLKESDRLWLCPHGHHFFHTLEPAKVGQQICKFWQCLPVSL